jgi:cation:H+ antiporter
LLLAIGLIVAGIALLVLGGEALLRGAVGLATLWKVTPAVIGLTVVAVGTSIPELAVSAVATVQGQTDIAVANVVGSNIFNILVILGLCAAIKPLPITGNTIKLEYPVLLLVTLLLVVFAKDGQIHWLEGLYFLIVYIAFNAFLVGLVRGQMTAEEAQEFQADLELPQEPPRFPILLVLVAVGIACLSGGAHLTVQGAVQVARWLGWSERLIGLTIVSAGTGLPEVVASVVSAMRGRSDVAIGNVIGSNLFNILGSLGVCGLIQTLPVGPELYYFDSLIMLAITVLLFPCMWIGMKITRWEAFAFLGLYAAYVGYLVNSVAS